MYARLLSRLNLAAFVPLCLFFLSVFPQPASAAEIIRTPHAEAELALEHESAALGEENWIGLHLKFIDGWHTYWKNPGDSGIPVSISWSLPAEVKISDILWPFPEYISTPPLMNYGYSGEFVLPMKLSLSPNAPKRGSLQIHAKISWLVCREICIPEGGELSLNIPIAKKIGKTRGDTANLFDSARANLPRASEPDFLKIISIDPEIRMVVQQRYLVQPNDVERLDFFPLNDGYIKNAIPPKIVRQPDGNYSISLAKDENFPKTATEIQGVIVSHFKQGQSAIAYEFRAGIPTASPAPSSGNTAFWKILIFALLGGMLLNLMPCVFPVLAIKVLNFVKHGTEGSKRETFFHVFAYCVGVEITFVGLALLLVVLRQAGEQLGWGFQLQSPNFLFLLISTMYLMGLGFLGFFEFGGAYMGFGDEWTRGSGRLASFATGMLAVVVATPCTAPFLGTAIGAALTQPPLFTIVIFSCIAMGMCLPYAVLSFSPGMLRLLPRPGTWMVTLKEFLAFPLFATCVWLVWVLSLQTGDIGVVSTLSALVAFTFAIWAALKIKAFGLRLAILLLFFAIGLYLGLGVSPISTNGSGASAAIREEGSLEWKNYDPAAVSAAVASGKPVFVNFTAAWCITCKVNERVVFSNTEVREELKKRGLIAFKGDWTNRDATISKALAEYGRAGVPLYLLFKPGVKDAEVLPQILTPSAFLEALRKN